MAQIVVGANTGQYGPRAMVETTIGRYKTCVVPRLRAPHDAIRRTEAAIGAVMLHRVLAAGRPKSVRPARDVS